MEENKLEKAGQYCIKVRKGDWEIEIFAPEKDFVSIESNRLIEELILTTKATADNKAATISKESSPPSELGQPRGVKPQSLNEFFRQFKLQTNLEKILVLGYWCEIKQGQHSFTVEDIVSKYKEVKEPSPTNIHRDINNLRSKGLLLSAGKTEEGTAYELTNTGIEEVKSKLP